MPRKRLSHPLTASSFPRALQGVCTLLLVFSQSGYCCAMPSAVVGALAVLLVTHASGSMMRSCCVGQHWVFGVPPESYPPLWVFTTVEGETASGETVSGNTTRRLSELTTGQWSGFAIDVIDKLSLTMGFTYSLTGAPPYSARDDVNGVTARALLAYGMADFLMVPASDPDNQLDTRIYQTAPFHNSYYTGIVLKTKKPYSTFRFLDPFTASMYLTMALVVLGTSALLSVLDLIWPADSSGLRGKHRLCDGRNDLIEFILTWAKGIYHITCATLGGEDYEWLTWPLKILRTGLLMLILIVNATYTANLAAFLSAPSVQVHGPSTMDQLADSTVCSLADIFAAPALLYGGSMVTASEEEYPSDPTLGTIDVVGRTAWVNDKLDSGGCDVWLHDKAVLQGEYLAACDSREMASFINVAPIFYSFGGLDRTLTANLSAGLTDLIATPDMSNLKRSAFGEGLTCDDGGGDDTTPISVEMMAGVYIIFAAIAGLAIVVAVVLRVGTACSDGSAANDIDHTATDGEMLRALLGKVDQLLEGGMPTAAVPTRADPRAAAAGNGWEALNARLDGIEKRMAGSVPVTHVATVSATKTPPRQRMEMVVPNTAAPTDVAVAVQSGLARQHSGRRRHASSRNGASAAGFRGVKRPAAAQEASDHHKAPPPRANGIVWDGRHCDQE